MLHLRLLKSFKNVKINFSQLMWRCRGKAWRWTFCHDEMYKVFQRRPPDHERILECWLKDYKKIGTTQLASVRKSHHLFGLHFSLNNNIN